MPAVERTHEDRMDDVQAVMIIECDESASAELQLKAWAHLIASGTVWSLQGFYGRNATALIEQGAISKDGKVLIDPVTGEKLDA